MTIDDCKKVLKKTLFDGESKTYEALQQLLTTQIEEYKSIMNGDNPEAKLKFVNGKVVGVYDVLGLLANLKSEHDKEVKNG